jgi:hypothetical protein
MAKSKHVPYHAEAYPMPWGFNGALALPYRWFSGRPMNGHRYTNATGFRYGTAALDPSGYANGYQLLPGYRRFLYARLPLMLAPGASVLAVSAPEHAALLATGVSALLAKRADTYRRTRRFRQQVIEPVAMSVSTVLRMDNVAGKGHRWVSIPEDFRDTDMAKIVITLPVGWTAEQGDMARLVRAVGQRVQVDNLVATWHVHGDRPVVELAMPVKPPKIVDFVMATQLAEDMAEDALMMGLGARDAVEIFNLAMESPHLLIAGGSGAGKSELLAWLVGQLMRRGYGVAVLDAKFTSHMWLRKVPGVLYASESEELHEALIWLDQELLRRARFVSSGGDPETLEPLVILAEEMNGASNRLRSYWSSIKVTGDPGMSPALTALANLSSMGRELRMHILMAGQSMSAKAVGGPENRENFGGRALARATSNQWKMLAPQIKPAPVARQAPGRWHLVVGDTLREFQVPFVDLKEKKTPGAEARLIEWATGGRPGWDVPAAMLAGGGGGGGENVRTPSSEPVSALPTPEGISLRLYADEAGLDVARLTRWRERRGDFPMEVALGARGVKLYDRDHLRAYVRERLREPVSADD